mmetsp:Transcript_32679/g.55452  ORF Transcript_32679/g.55452 Transcript_32679/m.55452 type:complete len:338 (+) Transcript_32679:155-1168(+)
MGCICCMSEGAKVAKIMEALNAYPVSKLEAGGVSKAIGYPVNLEGQVILHPVNGYPVVWYCIKIYEQCSWEEEYEHRDQDGNTYRRRRQKSETKTIYTAEVGTEFRLVDGTAFCIVDCRSQEQSKIDTKNNIRGNGMPAGQLNPQVAAFVKSYPRKDRPSGVAAVANVVGAVAMALGGNRNSPSNGRYGRLNERWSYRYTCSFVDSKRKIAVVGDCQNGAGNVLRLNACYENTADETQLQGQGLEKRQIQIFKDMVKSGGAIFISDSDAAIATTEVAPVGVQLPKPPMAVDAKQMNVAQQVQPVVVAPGYIPQEGVVVQQQPPQNYVTDQPPAYSQQ